MVSIGAVGSALTILTRYGLSKVSSASAVCIGITKYEIQKYKKVHKYTFSLEGNVIVFNVSQKISSVVCGGGVSKLWTYGRVTAPYATPTHTGHCTLDTGPTHTGH